MGIEVFIALGLFFGGCYGCVRTGRMWGIGRMLWMCTDREYVWARLCITDVEFGANSIKREIL